MRCVRREKLGREIVRSLHTNVVRLGEFHRVLRDEAIVHQGEVIRPWVQIMQDFGCSFDLGSADVPVLEEELAMKVALIDDVIVEERQPPNPALQQHTRGSRTQAADANEEDTRIAHRETLGWRERVCAVVVPLLLRVAALTVLHLKPVAASRNAISVERRCGRWASTGPTAAPATVCVFKCALSTGEGGGGLQLSGLLWPC
jgi:hypothetical protein